MDLFADSIDHIHENFGPNGWFDEIEYDDIVSSDAVE